MYAFYADESGFSKGNGFEKDQPITVVAGILIDLTKLPKAIHVFDKALKHINKDNTDKPITELKFSDIRQGKGLFKKHFPKVETRADLLNDVLKNFEREIAFKIFYAAIDDAQFLEKKKQDELLKHDLTHPYLCATYRVLSLLEKYQSARKKNKGRTFVIFDEQNNFQDSLEKLVAKPLHLERFEQIFDTVYFGKSQHSKLIQIADLIAGMLRYYFWRLHTNKTDDYWFERMSKMMQFLEGNIIERECFQDDKLKNLYQEICTKKALPKSKA